MARKATALVASSTGLMILALVLTMSLLGGTGVEAWCVSLPSPDSNMCRKSGIKGCVRICRGYSGAQCDVLGDCLCLKCVDQGPPPHHHHDTREQLGV